MPVFAGIQIYLPDPHLRGDDWNYQQRDHRVTPLLYLTQSGFRQQFLQHLARLLLDDGVLAAAV
jgi:hypothetical protein